MIIAADSGSSYHKIYDGNARFMSPSVVSEWRGRQATGREIIVDNKTYMVGDSARTATTSVIQEPHLERAFHGSLNQYIQHCYALQLLGAEGEQEIFVQSVPYSDSRNTALLDKLKARKQFKWISTGENGPIEHVVDFKTIQILPQGVGAMQNYCDEHPDDQPAVMMLVDIGSCTTDVIVIRKNRTTGQPDYCHEACKSIEHINATAFKKDWVDTLRSETRGLPFDKRFDFYDMMYMPVDNNFQMRVCGDIIDCEPAFLKAKQRFSDILCRILQATAAEMWGDIDRIIVTGGGGVLIDDDAFDARLRHLGLWSNVEGQFSMFGEVEEEAEDAA